MTKVRLQELENLFTRILSPKLLSWRENGKQLKCLFLYVFSIKKNKTLQSSILATALKFLSQKHIT